MADIRSPADDAPSRPSVEQRDGDSIPPSDAASTAVDNHATNNRPSHDGDAASSVKSPVGQQPSPSATAAANAPNPELLRNVNGVLKSEIGIATMLNRLKQSIASTREFALFLKKRATLEEDTAQGLKKVCRATQDVMRRPDHRTGTFLQAYDEMVWIHERMAENSTHFGASLQQMHDDLVELAMNSERSRKMWKTNGLAAEQKVSDAEQAMRKSKTKYDSLADEYERARTGEARQTGKVLNAFKNKSAAQQEEDLLKKVQAADQTYHGHVQTLQTEKAHLETSTRPEAIKALQDLIKELDSGLSLQMQKFAAFNEKLLLSNGLSISPIKGPGGDTQPASRSLRHAVMSIDNDRDLNEFIASHHSKVSPSTGEIKYERNPVLAPQPTPMTQGPPPASPQGGPPPQMSGVSGGPGQFSIGGRSSTGNFGASSNPQGPPQIAQNFSPGAGPEPPRPFGQQQPHNRSFSQGNMQQQHMPPPNSGPPPPAYGAPPASSPPYGAPPSGAPQLGALSFQSSQSPQQSSAPFHSSHERKGSSHMAIPPGAKNSPPPQVTTSAPLNPVFGVPLSRLYERDGLAVPLAVYQCIQAVDLFGLGVEGIYRQSGSTVHIQKLKHMFDTESQSEALDFRNPENFFHDVNSVTGLLKQFFRELPDPVLTSEHHDSLVAAAKHDDDIVRRDSLHAIINSLPDPNYATLRALALHLYRVMDNAHINRMNSHNLAVIFGPTLMGTDPTKAIADAGWQIKVIDTILQNTYQIFDED